MKQTIVLLLSLLCVSAFGQNSRYDAQFPSITNSTSTPFLVANVPPNSPILSVCHSPANQVPCTNYATTYDSVGNACSNGAQDTPQPQPSNCQSVGDAQGNIGFWAPSGTYDYTVCIQNNCSGPYTVTLGGGTGGGDVHLATVNAFTNSNSFTNSGIFTNTQMNLYVQSIVNGCNPLTEYQYEEGAQGLTAAFLGCVAAPIGSTVHETNGIAGFVNNLSTSTNAVGVRGQAHGLAVNAHVWGGVFIADDGGFSNNQVLGAEIDIGNFNAASSGAGWTFGGTLQNPNNFVAVQIPALNGVAWNTGFAFGTGSVIRGINFQTGATSTPSGSTCALCFNPTASSVNQPSQGIDFEANDPSSGQNTVDIYETAAGNLLLANSKAGTGLSIAGSSSGASTFVAPATGGGTATLPAGSGTLCYAGNCGVSQGPYQLQNCVTDQTGSTFQQTATLTNYFYGHYEFAFNPASFPIWFNCTIKLPHVLPSGSPKLIIDSISANDGTASHTMSFGTCDGIISTSINISALSCPATQNFVTTSTAYAPTTLTFNVQSTLAADGLLIVQIKATAESGLSANVLANNFYLEWQ